MNDKQRNFCREYIVDFNATAAYRRAYPDCDEDSAHSNSSRMMTNDDIVKFINELKEQAAARAELTADWVLNRWKRLADADPNELTTVRIICCRFCWGIEHKYQWREREYMEAVAAAMASDKPVPLPDGSGGLDYDARRLPNAECPECLGAGYERITVKDTSKLSPAARELYGGVEVKKDGSIKVITRNQDAALLNIAKYIGMVVDKKEHSGPDGKPIPIASLKADDLTDDQLAAIIAGNGP